MEEKIKEILLKELSYAYCDNCGTEDCEDCHRKYMNWSVSRETVESVINGLPSAQPERKKGHWVVDEDGNIECSECGHRGVGDNYCEHCGADMRGN